MRLIMIFFVLSTSAISGCIWEQHQQLDVGSVCLKSGESQTRVNISVLPDLCMNECIRVVDSQCEATLDGMTITVSSQLDLESKSGTCSLMCGQPEFLDCGELGPLEPGTYTVIHGETAAEIALPEAASDPCDMPL